MAHEIDRILAAAGRGPWFIQPEKAEEIVNALLLRAELGPRATAAYPDRTSVAMADAVHQAGRVVRVVRLHGAIVPRGNMMSDVSGAVSLDRFGAAFRQAAAAPDTAAIVLDIDSPGGQIDLVPETVAMIRAAAREDRPIVAVANTLAASAAYWIACACGEIVATPSGQVGSIGVFRVHDDLSARANRDGLKRSYIFEGPRKVEGNPFEPLGQEARMAMQAQARAIYGMFTRDVAKGRGVPVSVVEADPETAERHMGGGRSYLAAEAVRLGMADRVATLDDTIARLARGARGGTGRSARASTELRRMALED
jgi:signal peptide peptidase SppA